MVYLIMAHADDAKCLELCMKRVREIDKKAIFYIANDPANPVEGIESDDCFDIRPEYRRNGSLLDLRTTIGNLLMMQKIVFKHACETIVKLDCDTYINAICRFCDKHELHETWAKKLAPNYDLVVCERVSPFLPVGCCMSFHRLAIRDAIKYISSRGWPENVPLPEDELMFMSCLMAGKRCLLIPHSEGVAVGLNSESPSERHRNAAIVHCGEPDSSGRRVSRDVVYKRMLALDEFMHA